MLQRTLRSSIESVLPSGLTVDGTGPYDPQIHDEGRLREIRRRVFRLPCDRHFDLVDLHEFGMYYDPTLMAWAENFEHNWPKIETRYGERFHRMWRYDLLSCAALFRARKINLWQFVFRQSGASGYVSVR